MQFIIIQLYAGIHIAISCKNTFDAVAKSYIPESECMNRWVITRSDMRMQPRLSILNA